MGRLCWSQFLEFLKTAKQIRLGFPPSRHVGHALRNSVDSCWRWTERRGACGECLNPWRDCACCREIVSVGMGRRAYPTKYNLLFACLFAVICECFIELMLCHSCYFHGRDFFFPGSIIYGTLWTFTCLQGTVLFLRLAIVICIRGEAIIWVVTPCSLIEVDITASSVCWSSNALCNCVLIITVFTTWSLTCKNLGRSVRVILRIKWDH